MKLSLYVESVGALILLSYVPSLMGFTTPCRTQNTNARMAMNLMSSEEDGEINTLSRRRVLLESCIATSLSILVKTQPSNAAYVMDDETGDFVQVEDVDWQTARKQRLDKASTMSQEEIFQAARGAGNVKDGGEGLSEAAKKRRALSSCRSADVRTKANAGNERECTARVLSGDYQFLLDAL